MTRRWIAQAHIPQGSADAQWHIVDSESDTLVCIVDPEQAFVDAADVAQQIAEAMNTCKVLD